MSNFLLKDPECVLIHIPKTGGSSIRRGIWNGNYIGPKFNEIPSEWNDLPKFAFVRHPVNRLVSAYRDFVSLRKVNLIFEDFCKIVMDENIPYHHVGSLKNRIKLHDIPQLKRILMFKPLSQQVEIEIRHHTIPQYHPYNCLNKADYIGYYENFMEDLKRIFKEIGISIPQELPHLRNTKNKKIEVTISEQLLQKIKDFYEEDFVKLNYNINDY